MARPVTQLGSFIHTQNDYVTRHKSRRGIGFASGYLDLKVPNDSTELHTQLNMALRVTEQGQFLSPKFLLFSACDCISKYSNISTTRPFLATKKHTHDFRYVNLL